MSRGIKTLVVEDMAIARADLEAILEDNNYDLIGSTASAEEAWIILNSEKCDMALVDINLAGDKNGIWLAEKIRKNLNIPIIYLTAFGDEETRIKVLKTKPDGYLMKPYDEPTLLTTMAIAVETYARKRNNEKGSLEDGISLENILFLKDGFVIIKIDMNEIYYLESEGNYVIIYERDEKHTVRAKLVDLMEKLPKDIFFQIHRRYAVNFKNITALNLNDVEVLDRNLPISRTYKPFIKAAKVKLI